MVELEEPLLYDGFVRGLKGKILGGELGGERGEMWDEVRRHGLGLVLRKESERSKVGDEEAAEVSFLPPPHPFLGGGRVGIRFAEFLREG